jgi:hypothetical protein
MHSFSGFRPDKEVSSNYRFACGIEYTMLESFRLKQGIEDVGFIIPISDSECSQVS